ncbi:DEMETER-like protein [Actinidia chinensis var. chinensis]|uniref:DEMETER-like protein n=1 Tax=Actinidia chinensis var. chinensis TaxID=1590841 RepID=A0A2R6RS70_ACTCC|nr:DEMETER-like protein [Actinidia chinensis var. chinensis]
MRKELQEEEGSWVPKTPSAKSIPTRRADCGVTCLNEEKSQIPSFSTPSKKGNATESHKDDVNINKQSRKKPRRKKYCPKVVVEVKAKKTPKPSTPKPCAPKPSKHATSKRGSHEKKEDAGKNSFLASTKPSKYVGTDGQEVDANYVSESDTKEVSARRALNFDLQNHDSNSEKGARTIIHQYQRRKKKMDMPLEERGVANDCCAINKTICRNNCLKVHQKRFDMNQCQRNSRKLGPNFPRCFKKRRMERKKAMDDSSQSILVAGFSQSIFKKRRTRRRKATKFGAWQSIRASPTESRSLAAFNDPNTFQCVVSLTPLATSKKKRSNKFTRRLNFGSSAFIFSCNHLPPAPVTLALNDTIQSRREVQLADNENMVIDKQFKMGFLDSAVTGHNKKEGCPKRVIASVKSLLDEFSTFTDVIKRLEVLSIRDEGGQLFVQHQNAYDKVREPGTLSVYNPKKRNPLPKVDNDQETMRVWKLLMANQGGDVEEKRDMDNEKWWEEQRNIFRGRVDSFIARMHLIQGNRRFSPWKGSVVDSVVGVFLTQNVSDHLSSSAFMSLSSKFPLRSAADFKSCDNDGKIAYDHESVGSNVKTIVQDEVSPSGGSSPNNEAVVQQKATTKAQEATDLCASSSACQVLPQCRSQEVNQAKDQCSSKNDVGKSEVILETRTPSRKTKSKVGKKQESTINWDDLRKTYAGGKAVETSNIMDSLDWEGVRQATVDVVADAIKERGQHHILAERIKDFLDRLVRDHGRIDLEWLRAVPPDKAKEYLLSYKGLGLKSVECVRLLTLHHHAFPVDTNVGRVAVRLGWVPLQPLPESLQLHLLEQYPLLDNIQIYLWPRLCTLDQKILYELHYQMITFGKVFCRKRKPNCNACPMRGECRHFASAFASARVALPGPQEKSMSSSMVPDATVQDSIFDITPATKSTPEATFSASRYQTKNCEPVIEYPSSPEPECTENLVRDIEDFYDEVEDDIPIIRLDTASLEKRIREFIEINNIPFEVGSISQALVALTPEAASIPLPKLKEISRLRTVHYVYELPDKHCILAGFDKREPDDPCPYLLSIWTSVETAFSSEPSNKQCNSQGSQLCNDDVCFSCNNIPDQNSETVRGTILIPCRTATRGRFPLNGTYFQVNEVFADDETSQKPLTVPRAWIWNLQRRNLLCGANASTIFSGLSTMEIQSYFWKGFMCVRAFNRKTRGPTRLSKRFHISTVLRGKRKFRQDE